MVELHPELKSNQLQDELEGMENRLAVARRRYNDSVRAYNATTRKFPIHWMARAFGFQARDHFEEPDAAQFGTSGEIRAPARGVAGPMECRPREVR